jgi:hypothetical protein
MNAEIEIASPCQPVCHEHARAVVALPENATFYDGTHYVPIVWESIPQSPTPQPGIVGDHRDGLPYFPAWRLIDLLCSDRARRTVEGQLRDGFQIVTPERYLGLWREALARPLTADDLAGRHGLSLRVTLGAMLERERGARCPWNSSPFDTFEDFEALYGGRFVRRALSSGHVCFEVTLDLREPDAACHVFYAHALLSRQKEAQPAIHVDLVPVAGQPCPIPDASHQVSLLEEQTA